MGRKHQNTLEGVRLLSTKLGKSFIDCSYEYSCDVTSGSSHQLETSFFFIYLAVFLITFIRLRAGPDTEGNLSQWPAIITGRTSSLHPFQTAVHFETRHNKGPRRPFLEGAALLITSERGLFSVAVALATWFGAGVGGSKSPYKQQPAVLGIRWLHPSRIPCKTCMCQAARAGRTLICVVRND